MAHHSHSSRNALLMFSSKFPSHLYLQITFHHIRSFRSAEKTTGRTHSKQQHLWMCWGIHKLFFSFCSYRHLRPQAHNKIPQKLIQACRTHTSCLLEDQSTVCNQAQMVQTGTPQCGFTWNDELSCKEACCCKPLTCSLPHNPSNCWRIVVLSHCRHDDCLCLCWVCLRWGHC